MRREGMRGIGEKFKNVKRIFKFKAICTLYCATVLHLCTDLIVDVTVSDCGCGSVNNYEESQHIYILNWPTVMEKQKPSSLIFFAKPHPTCHKSVPPYIWGFGFTYLGKNLRVQDW